MMDSDDIIAESSFMPPQALTLAPTQVSDAGNQVAIYIYIATS